jgi:hypothetical protein
LPTATKPKKKAAKKKRSVPPKKKSVTQRILEVDENKNSDIENQKLLAELDEVIAEMDKKEAELKDQDPFWYYEASDGKISEEGQEFLKEFLKPEDIPEYIESQIDIHSSKASVRLAAGGNQSGKSCLAAIEALIWATGEVPYSMISYYPKELIPTTFPQHIRMITVDRGTMLNNIIPTLQKWVPRRFLTKGKWSESFSSEQRTLFLYDKGKLKGTIEIMTNKQDVESFQGPPRHGLVLDETPKWEIYKECLMRFTTAERLKVLFSLTPTSGMNWVADEILNKEQDTHGNTIECFKMASITNKYANLNVLRQALGGMGSYDEIKMRLLGEFVSLAGLIYPKFSKKIHVCEPFDVTCDCGFTPHIQSCPASQYLIFRGLDPHQNTPTACVWVAVDRENNRYIYDCGMFPGDTDEIKAQIAERSKNMRLGRAVSDKSANVMIRAFNRNMFEELRTGKNPIRGLVTSEKWKGSIRDGVTQIKKLMRVNEDTGKSMLNIMDKPCNKQFINSMRTLEREQFSNEDERGEKDKIKEGKHHLHAAYRYAEQYPINFYEEVTNIPQVVMGDEDALW